MAKFSLRKLFNNTFEDHEGRPGKIGGSLPRTSGSSQERKPNLVNVFHGTSTDIAKKILKEGIKKSSGNRLGYGKGRPDSVYFTTNSEQAIAYGEGHSAGGDFAVVDFFVPEHVRDWVKFDDVDQKEFGVEDNYRMEINIPPSWINQVIIYDSNGGVKKRIKSTARNARVKRGYSVFVIDQG